MSVSSKAIRRRMRLFEALESRHLLAIDFGAAIRPEPAQHGEVTLAKWRMDQNRQVDSFQVASVDADRSFGLSTDFYADANPSDDPVFLAGDWFNQGSDFPIVVRQDPVRGLWQYFIDSDGTPETNLSFHFGLLSDIPVAGDWEGDGRDNAGVARPNNGFMEWLLDLNNDSIPEIPIPGTTVIFGLATDRPVIGDWNGDGRDKVGVTRVVGNELHWFLDINASGTYQFDGSEGPFIFGSSTDQPIVGDWDVDGISDLGFLRDVAGFKHWYLDTNRDGSTDIPPHIYGLSSDRIVTGNWQFSELNVAVTRGGQAAPTNPLYLGDGTAGELPAVATVTISNSGNQPLALSGTQVPSGFITDYVGPTSIAPGGQLNFQVSLDTNVAGYQAGLMQISSNDSNEPPLTLGLEEASPTLHIVPPDTAVPVIANGVVALPPVFVGQPLSITFKVTNPGTSTLRLGEAIVSEPGRFVVAGLPLNVPRIQPNPIPEFTVTVNTATVFAGETTISIPNNTGNGDPFVFRLSAIVAEPQPGITIRHANAVVLSGVPKVLPNIDRDLGNTFTFDLSLINSGNTRVRVEPVGSPSGDFVGAIQGLPVELELGQILHEIKVTLNTQTLGLKTGTIRLAVTPLDVPNPPIVPDYVITIQANVVAIPKPQIAVTVAGNPLATSGTVDFGTGFSGDRLEREFAITNNGTAPLLLTPNAIPGGISPQRIFVNGKFGIAPGDTIPTSIAAGQTVQFKIRSSTLPGPQNGKLQFLTNVAGSEAFEIALTGHLRRTLKERLLSFSSSTNLVSTNGFPTITATSGDLVRLIDYDDQSYGFVIVSQPCGDVQGVSTGRNSVSRKEYISLAVGGSNLKSFYPDTNTCVPLLNSVELTQLLGTTVDAITTAPNLGPLLLSLANSKTFPRYTNSADPALSQVDSNDLIKQAPKAVGGNARDLITYVKASDGDVRGLPNIDAASKDSGISVDQAWTYGNVTVDPADVFKFNLLGGLQLLFDASQYNITNVNLDAYEEISVGLLSAEFAFADASVPLDYGDTPTPYPSASHFAFGPRLGRLRDVDSVQQEDFEALGDDLDFGSEDPDNSDDEDGISFSRLETGVNGGTIVVDVGNAPVGAKLDGWIDWNADGDWDDAGEQIANTLTVNQGVNLVRFDVPGSAAGIETFARFRISTAGGLAVDGNAWDGEVEDYRLVVSSKRIWDGGGGDLNWFNAANWAGDTLPGPSDAVVISAAGGTIQFAGTPGELVTVASFYSTNSLNISSGGLYVMEGLEFAPQQTLSVAGSSSGIRVAGPAMIDSINILVTAGGYVAFPSATSYRHISTASNQLFSLLASGDGSVLDLSGLQGIINGAASGSDLTITAEAGGQILLSGLKQITDPIAGDVNYSSVRVLSDGAGIAPSLVDLSSLQSFIDRSGGEVGNSVGQYSRLTVSGAGILNLGNNFRIAEGVYFSNRVDVAELTSMTHSRVDVDASGADFPSLTHVIDSEFYVVGGLLDIGAVIELTHSVIDLSAGGTADVSQVQSINRSSFSVKDGVTLAFPMLNGTFNNDSASNNEAASFYASGQGSVLDLSGLRAIINGENSGSDLTITAEVGGQILLSGVTQIADPLSGDVNYSSVRVLSDGAGITPSLVDLSSLQSFVDRSGGEVGNSVGQYSRLTVAGAGVLNLGNSFRIAQGVYFSNRVEVAELTSMTHSRVDVDTSGADFPSLTHVIDSEFYVVGGLLDIGSVIELTHSVIDLSAGGTADVSQVQSINRSSFSIKNGVTLAFPTLNGTFNNDSASNNEAASFYASGQDSVLDLSGLRTIINGENSGSDLTITAEAGGQILLSGVTQIADPLSGDVNYSSVRVLSDGAGITPSLVDLSSLQSFVDRSGGELGNGVGQYSRLAVAGAGVLNLGNSFRVAEGVYFSNRVDVAELTSMTHSRVDVDTSGANFPSLTHVIDSEFFVVGGLLEIGAVIELTHSLIDLSAGGTADVAQVRSINRSSFSVKDGVTLAFPMLNGTFNNDSASNNEAASFYASGQGSVLDLSGLQAIINGENSGSDLTITAEAGGQILLPGVKQISDPLAGILNYSSVAISATGSASTETPSRVILSSLIYFEDRGTDEPSRVTSSGSALVQLGPIPRHYVGVEIVHLAELAAPEAAPIADAQVSIPQLSPLESDDQSPPPAEGGLPAPATSGSKIEWIGGDGSWTEASNWSLARVPGPLDDVVIDVAGSVHVTIPSGNFQVRSLYSAESMTFNQSVFVTTGVSLVDAPLILTRSTIRAEGPFAAFHGFQNSSINGSSFYSYDGGYISLPVTNYQFTSTGNNQTASFVSSGPNSRLEFPALTSITGGTHSGSKIAITAVHGGEILFGNVAQIVDASSGDSNYRVIEIVADGPTSHIDLTSLQRFEDVNAGGFGTVTNRFSILQERNDAEISLSSALVNLVGIYVSASTSLPDSVIHSLQTITNSRLDLQGGARSFDALTAAVNSDFFVREAGVDFPLLADLTRGSLNLFNDSSASFPALLNINGASFEVSEGAVLAIPATSYAMATTGNNQIASFVATGPGSRLEFPALTSITGGTASGSRVQFTARHGGEILLGNVTQVVDASSGDSNYRAIDIVADGPMSHIDLTSLQRFEDVNAGGFGAVINRFSILQERNGAEISLSSALVNLVGIYVSASTSLPDSVIHSLQTITNSRLDLQGGADSFDALTAAVNSDFFVREAEVDFPLLADLTRGSLNLSSGAITSFPALLVIDGASFDVSEGAILTLPATSYTMATTGNNQIVSIVARGPGSRLEFPSLSSITGGTASGSRVVITAEHGGEIELSNVTQIIDAATGATNYRSIDITADGPTSHIDLTSLQRFEDFNAGGIGGVISRFSTVTIANFARMDVSPSTMFDGIHTTLGAFGEFHGVLQLKDNSVLAGVGTLVGTVINEAIVSPGITGVDSGTGRLRIEGDYYQLGNGRIQIQIRGVSFGHEFDGLDVIGLASLAGTVDVTLISGYQPASGIELIVISAQPRIDSFDTVNSPLSGNGNRFFPAYDLSSFRLLSSTVPAAFDYGDAPAGFPVTFAEDGARHNPVGPRFGQARDSEDDGLPSLAADSDDLTPAIDDEDGVVFSAEVVVSSVSASVGQVAVDIQNADANSNRLDAWIDFNRDGDWDDVGEHIFNSFDLGTSNGVQSLSFTVPKMSVGTITSGQTVARFRISTQGGLLSNGYATDGEVEDHLLTISEAPYVENVLINEGAGGRSQVTTVRVDFGMELDHAALANAFVVTQIDKGTQVGVINVSPVDVAGKTSVILTFNGLSTETRQGSGVLGNSLADGNYRLDVLANHVKSTASQTLMLDDYIYGAPDPASDGHDQFFRLFGDTDGDRDVDGQDYGRFGMSMMRRSGDGMYDAQLDFDGDQDVDGYDYSQFGKRFQRRLP